MHIRCVTDGGVLCSMRFGVIAEYPQVHTVTRFIAREPDELDLEEADVVSVYQKSPDGQNVVSVIVLCGMSIIVVIAIVCHVHRCFHITDSEFSGCFPKHVLRATIAHRPSVRHIRHLTVY